MNLKIKLLALVALPIVLLTGLSLYLNAKSSDELIRAQSIKMAQTVATQVVFDRKHYVHGVIKKVKGTLSGPIKSGGYVKGGQRVPLPAEFIKLVADDVKKSQKEYSYGIVSLWNLNRENNLGSDFLKKGFEDLLSQEKKAKSSGELSPKKVFKGWEPYYRFTRENDRDVLRFMKADPASGAGCVSCHNQLEASEPFLSMRKNQGFEQIKAFALNDLMGAIDVTIDLEEARSMTAEARSKMIIFSIFVALCILILAYFALRYLIRPVDTAVRAMREISEGDADLTRRLQEGEDEVGQLGAAFNTFIKRIQNSIVEINSMSEKIASTSERVSKVSSELTIGTQDTNEQVGKVAGASEEMSDHVGSMASATEEMNVNVASVSSAAEQMSVNMDSVAGAMEEMSVTGQDVAKSAEEASSVSEKASSMAKSATEKMNHLDEASQEIGKVTEVIKRIAEQTNLLALNATIEAASAGDAGKGFAVVAGEIKELANQSAQAAEDIAQKIEGVQKNTQEAVGVIGEVTEIILNINGSVGSITRVVGEQEKAMGEISKNVADSNQAARNIAKSIAEVGKGTQDLSKDATRVEKGTSEVSKSIQSVSCVAKRGEQSAEEVSEVVDNLVEISAHMGVFVDSFKLSASESDDFFKWRNSFSVQVPIFDEEHKKILFQINELYRAKQSGTARNQVSSILDKLVEVTVDHFDHEEQVFAEYSYIGSGEQKSEHTDLLKQVGGFVQNYKDGRAEVDDKMMKFLKEWLLTHILKLDRQYIKFLKDKEIK